MAIDSAIIYIDNIRDAFVKHDPDNAGVYQANAENYKLRLREAVAPLRQRIQEIPQEKTLAGEQRRGVQLPGPGFWHE